MERRDPRSSDKNGKQTTENDRPQFEETMKSGKKTRECKREEGRSLGQR